MRLGGDANIKSLTTGSSQSVSIGIDFNDTLQPAKFEIRCVDGADIVPHWLCHVTHVTSCKVRILLYCATKSSSEGSLWKFALQCKMVLNVI